MSSQTSSYQIRPVNSSDAKELADLLNAIIRKGGTTALEQEFTPDELDVGFLTGPNVYCCHVAIDLETKEIVAFQTVEKSPDLQENVGDIATFARIDRKQSGAGTALFSATKTRASELGLKEINATIRADNTGGLCFYSKLGFMDYGLTEKVPLMDGTLVNRIHKRFVL